MNKSHGLRATFLSVAIALGMGCPPKDSDAHSTGPVSPSTQTRTGRWVVYSRGVGTQKASSTLHAASVGVTGQVLREALIKPSGSAPADYFHADFSPDGRLLAFVHGGDAKGGDLELLDMGGDQLGTPNVVRSGVTDALFSRDGGWLVAKTLEEDGRRRLVFLRASDPSQEVMSWDAGKGPNPPYVTTTKSGKNALLQDANGERYAAHLQGGELKARALGVAWAQLVDVGEYAIAGGTLLDLGSDDDAGRLLGDEEGAESWRLSPDGAQIALAGKAAYEVRSFPALKAPRKLLAGPAPSATKYQVFGLGPWSPNQRFVPLVRGTGTQELFVADLYASGDAQLTYSPNSIPEGFSYEMAFDSQSRSLFFIDVQGELRAVRLGAGLAATTEPKPDEGHKADAGLGTVTVASPGETDAGTDESGLVTFCLRESADGTCLEVAKSKSREEVAAVVASEGMYSGLVVEGAAILASSPRGVDRFAIDDAGDAKFDHPLTLVDRAGHETAVRGIGWFAPGSGLAVVTDGKRAGVYLPDLDTTVCLDDAAPGAVNVMFAEVQPRP